MATGLGSFIRAKLQSFGLIFQPVECQKHWGPLVVFENTPPQDSHQLGIGKTLGRVDGHVLSTTAFSEEESPAIWENS